MTSILLPARMHDGKSISHEESLRFCGLARVHLDALSFEHASFQGHREPSADNVARLVRVFRIEGCSRLEEANFVKALVNRRDLDAALASEHLTLPQQPPRDWSKQPILRLQAIECLNGLHRVLAERDFFVGKNRWWIAKIYTDGRPMPFHVLAASRLMFLSTYHLLVLAALPKSMGIKRLPPMARSSAKSGIAIEPPTAAANGGGGRDYQMRRETSYERY